ncbi:glycoside hydrolase family 66 protein [Paenibacillus sp. FSL E2-0201]|uniref:glycoside hydrolase family 66 protein n=1 Tax=Paenibacillus sp. FSL E2-0201 TaxID=2954726 RepID=UPI0030DD4476
MKLHLTKVKHSRILLACFMTLAVSGCRPISEISAVQVVSQGGVKALTTDKANYKPGESVSFSLQLSSPAPKAELIIQYRHLGEKIGSQKVKTDEGQASWSWTPPKEDYKGYMVEVFVSRDYKITDQMNIAVDVSSDWSKFPRYGYLSDFPSMGQGQVEKAIERLNRFHINGIQFYDWQYKHHDPIKTFDGKPAKEWEDIASRKISFNTVKSYINLAHSRNMRAMNYNLIFGAYEDAAKDGVSKEWGLFKDRDLTDQDKHPLPGWISDIMLYDPSNPEWQSYLIAKEKGVLEHLPFDGWHVDQLGDRGTLYNSEGQIVKLPQAYVSFLKAAKKELDVDYVMNAVDQYGQGLLAALAPVDFLYTEVWSYPEYGDLKEVIDSNNRAGRNKLNTVLAAYMNYEHSKSGQGMFNTPGVLLTDAVIFASGGSHLELGENMLSNEYFPNKNLSVPPELEAQLIRYYDFLTAYQNILRDGLKNLELKVSGSADVEIKPQPEQGRIWSFTKHKADTDIIHFINFIGATTMEWKDNQAEQAEPPELEKVDVVFPAKRKVSKVMFASPDYYQGSPIILKFEQKDGNVFLQLPKLKYWDLITVEYE